MESLKLKTIKMAPLTATIANGTTISSGLFCPSVTWSLPSYNFSFPIVIMSLGIWDVILGLDWMAHYNIITFDFK